MLCRESRQQANDPLVNPRHQFIGRNKHRKNTPSYHRSLAVALLLVDWSTSLGHSRVFTFRNNLKNTDTQGGLKCRSQAALN